MINRLLLTRWFVAFLPRASASLAIQTSDVHRSRSRRVGNGRACADVTNRLPAIGQPVLAINRVGASGAIGAQAPKLRRTGTPSWLCPRATIVNKYTIRIGLRSGQGFRAGRASQPCTLYAVGQSGIVSQLGPDLSRTPAQSRQGVLAYEGSSIQAIASYTKKVLDLPIGLVAYARRSGTRKRSAGQLHIREPRSAWPSSPIKLRPLIW
jgi:hypothetical protein